MNRGTCVSPFARRFWRRDTVVTCADDLEDDFEDDLAEKDRPDRASVDAADTAHEPAGSADSASGGRSEYRATPALGSKRSSRRAIDGVAANRRRLLWLLGGYSGPL